ncbi:MAG: hypothetical protein ACKVJG_14385 [Candidatus Latescibacterota bacterium]|jgi:hypothetical protein
MPPFLRSIFPFIRYNASHIFAGKFIYFLLLAVLVFIVSVMIHAYNVEVPPSQKDIYLFLLAPGILLIFYPSAYAIQADADARMLETLFGIPDYRYKIWLARHLVQQAVVVTLLFLLALFCRYTLVEFSVWQMVFHLFFPIFFISSLAFTLASLTRNGTAATVLLVVLILFFIILAAPLRDSAWNLFYNPFISSEALIFISRGETTFYNRVYLLVGSVATTLLALLRLQQREKFV